MEFFDRYQLKEIKESELPVNIDLGRVLLIDRDERRELTYNQYNLKSSIDQGLLLEKNKNLQDVFLEIKVELEKAHGDEFTVAPLIQRITNKIGLTEFEKLLAEKVFHIEEVFRQPHYLLQREIEKVHVSRAKRIPSKSYHYLASHTEDWVHKSIVAFKPSRILTESLDVNFDVYENQLTIVFVERSLVYLNSRLKEVQDIRLFLKDYERLLDDDKYQKGWYLKIQRNLRLIGSVYEDEHFQGRKQSSSLLSHTEQVLATLQKKLLALRKTDLFEEVSKKVGKTIALKNTNVLVNHKHYRYVRVLWLELQKSKPELSQTEVNLFEQNVLAAFNDYGKSVLVYCLISYLGYELRGTYNDFLGKHVFYPPAKCSYNSQTGIFKLIIGQKNINFLFISSNVHDPIQVSRLLSQNSGVVMYLSDSIESKASNLLPVSPLDADSLERVAFFIRKLLISSYLQSINAKSEFKRLLADYVTIFNYSFLKFDKGLFTYQITDYPPYCIQESDVLTLLENFAPFKGMKSRSDREKVFAAMKALIAEINETVQVIREHQLHCFHCYKKLSPHEVKTFAYISCSDCGTVMINNNGYVTLEVKGAERNTVADEGLGMDYISFNLSETDGYDRL